MARPAAVRAGVGPSLAWRRWRVADGVTAALAGGILAAACVMSPTGELVTAGGRRIGGLCLMHRLLGVDCPLCGMSRSFIALAHGHVAASLAFHPAGPLLFAGMGVALVAIAVVTLRGARPLSLRPLFLRAMNLVVLACVLAGAARWIVR